MKVILTSVTNEDIKNGNYEIPNSVTIIGESAFEWYNDLTNITIPDSVMSIEGMAFFGCSKLKNITYKGTRAQWSAITKGSEWDYITGEYTIHCTDGDIIKE